jgi:LAO/AO transport system kinase
MNEWARKIREGDIRALARAATGVENGDPTALETLAELAPFAGHARVVGITGAPGAGKSTLVDAMASALRAQGKTLAIIAVDPTSRRTGGAILGDRIRMQRHHADPGIFIRSMATRGATGGLARATEDLVRLMDCAGRDYVLIETVGVGQAEVEIASLAQVTVVVLVPGMGDDVQTIKAGIMEIADILVINKADQPGADRVERELQAMLGLAEGSRPPIVKTVATEGTGVEELVGLVAQAEPKGLPRVPGHRPCTQTFATINAKNAAAFLADLGLRVPEEGTRGPQHLTLTVPDLSVAVERLRESGATLLDGADRRLYVFVHPASAGGVLLELIQETEH